MSVQVKFFCDICGENTPREDLIDVIFKNHKEFTLKPQNYNHQGKHICKECARQLQSQLFNSPELFKSITNG